MNKVTFEYMDKEGFSSVSDILFGILADNMQVIAPTGNTREDDYKCWFNGVSDGLKRDERQIVLIKDSCNIIGFFQYYVNSDIFMMGKFSLNLNITAMAFSDSFTAFCLKILTMLPVLSKHMQTQKI